MHYRLVDCRPREEYLAGHLPGAVWVDTEHDLAGEPRGGAVGGRHPLPADETFAAWASRAGIGAGTFVIGYDAGTAWAARLWWLLRHFGHDDAAVIPFAAWHGVELLVGSAPMASICGTPSGPRARFLGLHERFQAVL